MDEATIFETLSGAVDGGRWAVVAGAVLLLLVSVARKVINGRLTGIADELTSAGSSMLGGVGLALLTVSPWWAALVFGLIVSPTSSGFWKALGRLIPKKSSTAPTPAASSPPAPAEEAVEEVTIEEDTPIEPADSSKPTEPATPLPTGGDND